MANYTKSTNFAVKDGLPSGDPLKVVKGTEIDTEFNNIATAVTSKADISSPTFLGTPFAPTASAGTNTNQIATTAFVTTALQALYPVGSIYINAAVSTNPGTLLGFGTWAEFGAGRVMVGLNASDLAFDTLEEIGGSKDAVVVSHTHTATTAATGTHSHTFLRAEGYGVGLGDYAGNGNVPNGTGTQTTATAGEHSHTVTVASTGSSGTNANVQPYIVVKMWKRTA